VPNKKAKTALPASPSDVDVNQPENRQSVNAVRIAPTIGWRPVMACRGERLRLTRQSAKHAELHLLGPFSDRITMQIPAQSFCVRWFWFCPLPL